MDAKQFFAELDRITRAYTNPLTVAEKIRRDYAQMPEPEHKPVEWWDDLAERRLARLAEQDNFPARPE